MQDGNARRDRWSTGVFGRRVAALSLRLFVGLSAVVFAAGALGGDALADDRSGAGNACSKTAEAALTACRQEVEDDFWITTGNCINLAEAGKRSKCFEMAESEQEASLALCAAQLGARKELCAKLGEGRCDPKFDPGDFVDPLQIGLSVDPNPYLPLEQGRRWVYEGGTWRRLRRQVPRS